jgi:hypothetical protein
VTLLEFDETSKEAPEVQQLEPKAQNVQLTVEEPGDVVVECPDHKPCNFVKGKSQSIISFLISKIQLKVLCYIYYCIKLGVG